jgi:hypothetical protein
MACLCQQILKSHRKLNEDIDMKEHAKPQKQGMGIDVPKPDEHPTIEPDVPTVPSPPPPPPPKPAD